MHALLDELQSLGFFRFTPTNEIPAVRDHILKFGYLFAEQTRRNWMSDAEELAEGGVATFIEEHCEDLAVLGAKVDVVADDFHIGGHYGVRINGAYYRMYSAKELESSDFWQLTQRRAFGAINHVLAGVESMDRIYSLYGGNDAVAVVLTPAMHEAIVRSGSIADREIPTAVDAYAPNTNASH